MTVSDRKPYCLGHNSIFQAQVINRGDDFSDTNEIRNRSNRLGHKLLDATSESKSIVSVSTVSNNLRSFLRQLLTDNNNYQRSEYNNRVLFLFYGIARFKRTQRRFSLKCFLTLFGSKLFGVLLKLCRFISGCAIKFSSVRLF